MPQESHYYTYPRQVARKAYMKAMDTKKGPVHINVPLFEPLVPELSRNHLRLVAVPLKWLSQTIVTYLPVVREITCLKGMT